MSTTIIPSPTATDNTSPFDSIRQVRDDGSEYWSARDLMPLLGYDQWRNFAAVVGDARRAAEIAGHSDQFAGSSKKVAIGSGAEREVLDTEMTRYGAYMVAMTCDGRKPEVAAAKTYFAVRTREAEVREEPKQLTYEQRVTALLLESSERIQQLEAKVELDAPKVSYYDDFVYDDDDLRTVRTLSAELQVGEEWLRNLLLDRKWIYCESYDRKRSNGDRQRVNRYSAYASKKPYFQVKTNHDAPHFKGELMHTLKITPPGAEAISRLVKKELAR